MAGYVKRIALIKTLRPGYSADGGELKGIVRCEAYAGFLKVEASLINFAPLSEGVFRIGVAAGDGAVVFDAPSYEGECDLDPSGGFACLVAHSSGGKTLPVACAVSGDNQSLLAVTQRAMERDEEGRTPAYDDEAVAEENYYELEADEDGRPVCEDKKDEEGQGPCRDEDDICPVEVCRGEGESGAGDGTTCGTDGEAAAVAGESAPAGPRGDETCRPRLARGGFFERMAADIERIFATYPRADALESVIEGSRWAKISYGNGAHYAFGVIYCGGNAKYLCYGVPVKEGAPCPESLAGRAGYVPVEGGGYWIMYQDADTGVSITVDGV